jgi:hypothetical protein
MSTAFGEETEEPRDTPSASRSTPFERKVGSGRSSIVAAGAGGRAEVPSCREDPPLKCCHAPCNTWRGATVALSGGGAGTLGVARSLPFVRQKKPSHYKNRHGVSSVGRGSAAPGGDSRTFWQARDPTIVGATDSSNFNEKDAHDDVLSNRCTRPAPRPGGRSTNTQSPPTHNRAHSRATRHGATHHAASHHSKPNTRHHTAEATCLRPDPCCEWPCWLLRLPCWRSLLLPPQGVIPPPGVRTQRTPKEHP